MSISKKHSSKKLSKLIDKADSDEECSEHELSYYINDRVKLMKEVLKIIKPKKIKSMAPHCLRNMKNEEINSMLLEELLGISNKRLKYIFNGQNLEEDSTDTEEEKPIDIISLDDISDDDFIDLDSDNNSKSKRKTTVKEEGTKKKIKKERTKSKDEPKSNEENLMSVLELLELQARARAIKSQLILEANKKIESEVPVKIEDSDNEDAIIIETPTHDEIVIASSESEDEENKPDETNQSKANNEDIDNTASEKQAEESIIATDDKEDVNADASVDNKDEEDNLKSPVSSAPMENTTVTSNDSVEITARRSEHSLLDKSHDEVEEGIVLNVDLSEMDCIICD